LYVFRDIDGLSGVIWELLLEGRKLQCLRNDGCRVQGSASALAGWLACDRQEELADQRWNELIFTTLHYDQIRTVFFVNVFIPLI